MLNRSFQDMGRSGCAHLETNVAHTARALADGAAQIVDVREPDEWAEGHIDGALLIPLRDLPRRMSELDPAMPVIAVCQVGARSLTAVDMLNMGGFVEAKSMAGGMVAWAADNHPVVR